MYFHAMMSHTAISDAGSDFQPKYD